MPSLRSAVWAPRSLPMPSAPSVPGLGGRRVPACQPSSLAPQWAQAACWPRAATAARPARGLQLCPTTGGVAEGVAAWRLRSSCGSGALGAGTWPDVWPIKQGTRGVGTARNRPVAQPAEALRRLHVWGRTAGFQRTQPVNGVGLPKRWTLYVQALGRPAGMRPAPAPNETSFEDPVGGTEPHGHVSHAHRPVLKSEGQTRRGERLPTRNGARTAQALRDQA